MINHKNVEVESMLLYADTMEADETNVNNCPNSSIIYILCYVDKDKA